MSPHLSVRSSLLTLLVLLSTALIGVTGLDALASWNRFHEAEATRYSSKTSALLLRAAGAWAAERGLTNTALADVDRASADTRAGINERRAIADESLGSALARLQPLLAAGSREQQALFELEAALEATNGLRRAVDRALAEPLSDRPTELRGNGCPSSPIWL